MTTPGQITVTDRRPQAAEGDTRYDLSNGWFISGSKRVHRQYQGYRYSAWEPGAGESGIAAFRGGAATLKALLANLNDRLRATDTCSQCSAGHAGPDGRCERHGKRIRDASGTEGADDTWTERFSAGWSDGEVTVIRDIRAGIAGPFGEYPAATLDEAERVLRANGYALSGPWEKHTNGHFAPLEQRPDPERPVSGRRTVHALPVDNSANNAERGAADGAEWAATLTQEELHQAIDAREATAESNPYTACYARRSHSHTKP